MRRIVEQNVATHDVSDDVAVVDIGLADVIDVVVAAIATLDVDVAAQDVDGRLGVAARVVDARSRHQSNAKADSFPFSTKHLSKNVESDHLLAIFQHPVLNETYDTGLKDLPLTYCNGM